MGNKTAVQMMEEADAKARNRSKGKDIMLNELSLVAAEVLALLKLKQATLMLDVLKELENEPVAMYQFAEAVGKIGQKIERVFAGECKKLLEEFSKR